MMKTIALGIKPNKRRWNMTRKSHPSTGSAAVVILTLSWVLPMCSSLAFIRMSGSTPISTPSAVTSLPSCFPREVPPGLRQEAVNNALDSRGLCINWSEMNVGVVHVKGKGCRDFLNNKFSNSFPRPPSADGQGLVREACLLTPKGRVVDKLTIPYFSTEQATMEAFLITSPDLYHQWNDFSDGQSSYLYRKLSPLVFPLDQITLSDCTSTSTVLALTCSNIDVINKVIVTTLSEFVDGRQPLSPELLPKPGNAVKLALKGGVDGDSSVIVYYSSIFPNGTGYTLLIQNDPQNRVRDAFCKHDGTDGLLGALTIRAREYETLRIEHCIPAVGREIMGDGGSPDGTITAVKAGPLELGLGYAVDVDKGCYLGQEGVAAMLRNSRGVPRTIYQVVFQDTNNDPHDPSNPDNKTSFPKAGDTLFVLGSNEEIKAGVLTSVEPLDAPSQGQRSDVVEYARQDDDDDDDQGVSATGMALIRRPEYIIRKMEGMRLDSIDEIIDPAEFRADAPLHGLEVIIGGTYTVGTLRAVSAVLHEMQQDQSIVPDVPSTVMGYVPIDTENIREAPTNSSGGAESSFQESFSKEESELQQAMQEAKAAGEAAQAAAAEAKRKQEKLEMLKARADAAMAARRRNKEEQHEADEEAAAAAEARRKQEKLNMLKARAEAAMAARRKKTEVQPKQDIQ